MIKRVLFDREFVSRARFPKMYILETLRLAGFDMDAEMTVLVVGGFDQVLIVQDDGKA